MSLDRKAWTAPTVVVLAAAASAQGGGATPFPDGGSDFISGIP